MLRPKYRCREGMSVSYQKRSFFHKLLPILICLALIPAILTGVAYDAMSRNMLMQQAREELGDISRQMMILFKDMLAEYEDILDNISLSPAVWQYLGDGKQFKYETAQLLQQHMFSRKNQVAIHLIPYHPLYETVSTGSVPNIYRYQVYKSWGIFAKLKAEADNPVLHINKYRSHTGESVSLSLARNVLRGGEAVGCVIVDVYRSTLHRYDIACQRVHAKKHAECSWFHSACFLLS